MKTLPWLIPILLTLHNIEEGITPKEFLSPIGSRIPDFAKDLINPSYPQFLVALGIFTAIPYLCALSGDLTRKGGLSILFLLVIQMVMFINVLPHVAMATFLKGYTPGLITSVLINLPFSLLLFRAALKDGWLSKKAFLWLIPLAVIAHGPGLWGLMIVSGHIAKLLSLIVHVY